MFPSRADKLLRLIALISVLAMMFSLFGAGVALAEDEPDVAAAAEETMTEETAPTEAVEDTDGQAPEAAAPVGAEDEAPEIDSVMYPEAGNEQAIYDETVSDIWVEDALDGASVGYSFPRDSSGSRYYIDPDTSQRHTGWLYLNDYWYYFDNDGNLVTGWFKMPSGYTYCFEDSGIVHRGWATRDGNRYYCRPSDATLQTGWALIDGYWYYFDVSTGKMITGWYKTPSGYTYYFEDTGIVHRGWATRDGDKYYCRPSDATLQTGWLEMDGEWYYFDRTTGKLCTGWQFVDNSWYYFYKANDPNGGPEGMMSYSTVIDGYTIKSSGEAVTYTEKRMKQLAQYYSSSTNYLILVDITDCKVGVFTGSDYNWSLQKYWNCSPGASSTPTVTGTFTVQSKGIYFDSGSARCYFYTQFYGNYLFHSVLYYHDGTLMDGRLGMHLSHGCVRLAYNNAYWIYSTVPRGTKVVVYE